MTETVPGPPLVCACGHNITVHWVNNGGCQKCTCRVYRACTISINVGRLLGLAEAWEHVAQVSSTAARGTYDDGLGRMAAHAAQKVREIIEDERND